MLISAIFLLFFCCSSAISSEPVLSLRAERWISEQQMEVLYASKPLVFANGTSCDDVVEVTKAVTVCVCLGGRRRMKGQ